MKGDMGDFMAMWKGKGDGKGDGKGYGKGDGKGYGKGDGQGYGKGYGKGDGKGYGKGDGKKGKGDSKGGKSKTQQKLLRGESVYHGQITAYNVEKKSGFIHSADALNECGSSVYAFGDVLERGTPCAAGAGDQVAFFIHWSPKGQPQASSPVIRLAVDENVGGYALKGTFKPGNNAEKGFGFILCEETNDFFGKDVYVNEQLLVGCPLAAGEYVSFNAYLNKEGKPNAKALERCDESWQPLPADLTVSKEVEGKGKGKGKGGGDKGGSKGKGKSKGWGWGGGDGWCGGKGDGWMEGGWDDMMSMMMMMKGKGGKGDKGGKGGKGAIDGDGPY